MEAGRKIRAGEHDEAEDEEKIRRVDKEKKGTTDERAQDVGQGLGVAEEADLFGVAGGHLLPEVRLAHNLDHGRADARGK